MTSVDERTAPSVDAGPSPPPADDAMSRSVTLARLRGPVTWWCLVAASIAAVGYAVGTVVAGRLAVQPTAPLGELLAVCVVGGAILDTAGRAAWAGVVDVAEGRLRGD